MLTKLRLKLRKKLSVGIVTSKEQEGSFFFFSGYFPSHSVRMHWISYIENT
jgi:hypothetical protein